MNSVVTFSVLVLILLWIVAGYPLYLALRARLAPDLPLFPVEWPTVTAIIPVHNGAAFLAAKLESVLASDYPADKLDVIVLSDGSTDSTMAIAHTFLESGRVRVVALPKGGKAVALTAAFAMVERDVILLTDVRQRLASNCVARLVAQLAVPTVGVVSGRLTIHSGETAGEANTGLYWRYETWIRDNLSRIDSILGATGPIYAIRRTHARPLPAGCILDDMWLPMQIVLDGYRSVLASDAVAWDYATSLSSEFNRKVRTQAGLYQLIGIEPRLFNPVRNRLFWSFLNLKLGRLLLPHILIGIAIASFFLPPPYNVLIIAWQAIFYGAAGADSRISERSALKRVSAPIAAFVGLVTAAFCAQAIFFRDPASLWKTTLVRVDNGR